MFYLFVAFSNQSWSTKFFFFVRKVFHCCQKKTNYVDNGCFAKAIQLKTPKGVKTFWYHGFHVTIYSIVIFHYTDNWVQECKVLLRCVWCELFYFLIEIWIVCICREFREEQEEKKKTILLKFGGIFREKKYSVNGIYNYLINKLWTKILAKSIFSHNV